MIRLAIVEDEKIYQKQLCEYANRYGDENHVSIQTAVYNDGMDILEGYAVGCCDIILCDIRMKFVDGMKTAEKIRSMDGDVIIIFITNMDSYAIHGYEIGALGYLLKPVKYTSFCMYFDRAIKIINSRMENYIVLPHKNGIMKLNTDEIYYIEHSSHYLEIHTMTGVETVRMQIMEMEERLREYHFSKCNRGCIVNLKHVQKLEGNAVLIHGEWLSVGRTRKKDFMQELTDYLGEEGR